MVVDAAGYRERRRETIERQADRAADRALKTGKEIELEPMSADRAARRPPAPQGSRRGRDVQRGRGTRALRDRRSAAQRLSAGRAPRSRCPTRRASALGDGARAAGRRSARAERGARPERAWRVHVADSLTGLEVEALRAARRIADVGAGAGFPGPAARGRAARRRVDLIESTGRKCEFIRQAIEATGLANAQVVCERSEIWAAEPPPRGRPRGLRRGHRPRGRPALDPAELASPLLRAGRHARRLEGPPRPGRGGGAGTRRGRAWRWSRSRSAWVGPYAGSPQPPPARDAQARPDPRRPPPAPGMAKKRPVRCGTERLAASAASCGKVARSGRRSTRSRTRRAASARRRPPSTSPPARRRAAARCCSCDLDPQCNATVALGLGRDERPSSYDCLTGECSVAEAARPAGPDNLWIVPANRDLAGASVELPRIEGSERHLRDELGPVRERFALTLLDCPPSLGPGDGERAGRRRPRDRPGAGRVPGARGAGAVPRHARPGAPRPQPGAGSDRRRDHHARRADEARTGRRAPSFASTSPSSCFAP